MSAPITDEQLCAYIDGELDAGDRLLIEQALAADERLRAKLASWTAQTHGLRKALAEDLNDELPERLLRMARRRSSPGKLAAPLRSHWAWLWARLRASPGPAGAVAFAALIGMVVGRMLTPAPDMDDQLVRLAAVAHHVYSPDKRQPVEWKGEDPALLTWISRRLNAKVTAPDLDGYRFLGGRLLAGAEEPAAQFMYEEASGLRLTLFVRTEGAASRHSEPRCDAYRGVQVCYWYADDVAYALAGEVGEGRLSALAQGAALSRGMAR